MKWRGSVIGALVFLLLFVQTASVGRLNYLTYDQYLDRLPEIYDTFSKEAVLRGSFDRFIQEAKGKRGTTPVDAEFLKEIEGWRMVLAKNIATLNPRLTLDEMNDAVQRTIDRIIFLRMAEDRGTEPYGQLQQITKHEGVYAGLLRLCQQADDRYNSGLFDFKADTLTPALKIDDDKLRALLGDLYYPKSPYEFSVLGADTLGNVYEQFLGKVIRLTTSHQAKVEEKPEVKKAGGVFYTPGYIVEYIVAQTVGKLIVGKSPKELTAFRVLDPACGSGSFLLGAYQRLLDHYLAWYTANATDRQTKGRIYESAQGWQLATAEKKRILTTHIFGVDIDRQAVEVTKLSLLLKVLEGENQETLGKQLSLFRERALPNLDANIKCGNSLIGPDYFAGQLLPDAEELRQVNPFDWAREFPDAMRAGGFDCVIGNPPYIPMETMSADHKQFFQRVYPELERKYDSSVVFILAMLKKLSPNGLLGFISSVTWQTGENYNKLRERLFTQSGIVILINLPFDVFKNAYVDTGIYILSPKLTERYSIYCFSKKERNPVLEQVNLINVPVNMITAPAYKIILDPQAQLIIARTAGHHEYSPLGDFTISTQGLAGNCFELSPKPNRQADYPFLKEGQVHRYEMQIEEIGYTNLTDKPSLQPFYDARPKILIRRVISRQDRLLSSFTQERMVFKKDINPFVLTDSQWNPYYVLGILNSKLISYLYIRTSSIATKDDFRQTTLAELRRLSIRMINFADAQDKARHDRMVSLVEQMLTLHQQLASAQTAHDRELIQRQIDATDDAIDDLVYRLYELSEDEIAIVKSSR